MRCLGGRWWRNSKGWRRITLADSLPKGLGRPWPPLILPWDFPLPALPPNRVSSIVRDFISLITLDGHILYEYALSPAFEVDAVTVFSQLETTQQSIRNALSRITVEQGMPPASDTWVMKNVVEGAIRSCSIIPERAMSQTEFVEALRRVLLEVASHLKTKPVTIAHTNKTYDGKAIEEFLSSKDDLEKALEMTWRSLPKDEYGKLSREYLRVGLDILAPATGLPPWGAEEKVDEVACEIFKMVKADDGRVLNRKEFNKMMLQILSSIMLQLEGKPICVLCNALIIDKSTKRDRLPNK